MNKKLRSITILGFALFAMLFGAGNLLLPASLGWSSGKEVWETFSGFTSSGIIAPALAIFAVMLSGNYFTDLGKRANTTFAYILAAIVMLCVGPVIALPRLGAAVYEVSVLPIIPEAKPVWVCFFFFGAVMFLSLSYKRIVVILGKYLGPLMVALLVFFIISGFFSLTDENSLSLLNKPFRTGFLEGYQTMDVLGGVIFAVVLINGAKVRGYTSDSDRRDVVMKSTILAVLLMLIIYGGLFYIGSVSNIADGNATRSEILIQISDTIFGRSGIYYISILMILVCLTTAIALTSAVSNFFDRITKNRLGYTEAVIMTSLISMILAIVGVDDIMDYAVNLLNIIYPTTLILVLTVLLFGKIIHNKPPYLVAVVTTIIIALMRVMQAYYPKNFNPVIEALPLHSYQMEWLIPAFALFIITWVFTRKMNS